MEQKISDFQKWNKNFSKIQIWNRLPKMDQLTPFVVLKRLANKKDDKEAKK
jgi:hypothetical protein